MDEIKNIFSGKAKPRIYLFTDEIAIGDMQGTAEQSNFGFFYLDGEYISNVHDFCSLSKRIIKFPPESGENLNSFLDCLRDLDYWHPNKRGHVIFFDKFEVFAGNDRLNFEYSLDALQQATEFWAETETPLFVFLRGEKGELASNLPTLIES